MLLDVERVAPCLPGAALDGRRRREFNGTMTIKLGPVTSRYEGTVRIEEADERRAPRGAAGAGARRPRAGHRGRDDHDVAAGGRGRHARGVETDMRVTGPAAQFGRGVMQDVSGEAHAPVRRLPGRGDGRAPRGAPTRGATAAARGGERGGAPPARRLRGDRGRAAAERAGRGRGARRRRAGPRPRRRRGAARTSSTWAPRRAAPCSSGPCPRAGRRGARRRHRRLEEERPHETGRLEFTGTEPGSASSTSRCPSTPT